MSELRNIKDTSPNKKLISQIEDMLQDAKDGDLRSMFYVKGWNDDRMSAGWSVDQRTCGYRMIGAVTTNAADFTMTNILADHSSAFRKTLDGK